MPSIDFTLLAGVPLGLVISLYAWCLQRRLPGAKVKWSLAYDAGLMAMFTFAGEAFAFFFLSRQWMAVAVGFLLAQMTVYGNWNRLMARQKEMPDEEVLEKKVRQTLLIMCCGMDLALCASLAWQLFRFFL